MNVNLHRLALIAAVVAFFVIILGAYVRLSHAGLGCPDWPGCFGQLTAPDEAHEIKQALHKYPHLEVDPGKAWKEMVHRYFASTLGLLIVIINIIAWKHRKKPDQPFKLPLFLLALVIAQGMFGMWTVTLKLWPQVVTTHLLGGFTTLSLLWLLGLRLNNSPWQQPNIPVRQWVNLRPLAMIALVLLVCQITLGGWTSSNYAALACPDLPTCQGRWLPPMDFANGFNVAQEIGPNYLGGQMDGEARVAVHMAHRMGAIVVTLLLGFLIYKLYQNAGGMELKRLTHVLLFLLIVQVSLGISNIVFSLPLWVAVAHNAGGALLLLTLVTLNYRLRKVTAF